MRFAIEALHWMFVCLGTSPMWSANRIRLDLFDVFFSLSFLSFFLSFPPLLSFSLKYISMYIFLLYIDSLWFRVLLVPFMERFGLADALFSPVFRSVNEPIRFSCVATSTDASTTTVTIPIECLDRLAWVACISITWFSFIKVGGSNWWIQSTNQPSGAPRFSHTLHQRHKLRLRRLLDVSNCGWCWCVLVLFVALAPFPFK